MFRIDIEIKRPPEVVFAYLADVEAIPDWYSAVEGVEPLTDSPIGKGARFRFVRNLPSGMAVNEVEISEFVPNREIEFTSASGPTPFTYHYLLFPHEDRTALRLEGEITGEGLKGPAALLASIAPTLFERGMRSNLAMLKSLIEAR